MFLFQYMRELTQTIIALAGGKKWVLVRIAQENNEHRLRRRR